MSRIDTAMLVDLAAEANLAPSVHNTQPARWILDEDGCILLAADLSRHLGSVTEILRDKRTNRSGVLTAPVISGPAVPGQWRSEANPVDIVFR